MANPDVEQISGSGMANVDRSDDPQARVNYLDAATRRSLDAKISSYAMLGLSEGDRVLDVGCGTGDDVQRMAEIVGASGKAVGLDSSETMLAQARERTAGADLPVEFVQGSAYELPFEDDSFDACRCERVLQHLDEPVAAIQEMARVVRPGGQILLLDPDFGSGGPRHVVSRGPRAHAHLRPEVARVPARQRLAWPAALGAGAPGGA